jgi:isochorismate pyruvate lyase
MKMPHECQNIEEIRKEIDDIDHDILRLIGKRITYIKAIIKYKNNPDDVKAKERHSEVITERRSYAESLDLDPDVIENMYQVLMDYSMEIQLALLKNK